MAERHPKMKIRTGDSVLIIAGKDKGQRGRVIRVIPERRMVVVEGLTKDKEGKAAPLNAVTKHRKGRPGVQAGDRIRVAAPLHSSKVMVIDPLTDTPTRVARKVEKQKGGKATIVRVAKKTGNTLDSEK